MLACAGKCELAAGLDRDRWQIAVAEARTRSASGHDGEAITIRNTVLRACRLA